MRRESRGADPKVEGGSERLSLTKAARRRMLARMMEPVTLGRSISMRREPNSNLVRPP